MTTNLVSNIAVSEIRREYEQRRLGEVSDRDLIDAVAAVVAIPRQAEANSFVLHAPLELIARHRLLPMVAPEARELARLHILAIASQYEAFGPGVEQFDEAPASASEILAELPSTVLPSTAAAGHASIYLAFLDGMGVEADRFAGLAAPLRQNLSLHPDWQIRWHQERTVPDRATDPAELFDVLVAAPRLGPPDSTFIHPLMMRVDESGLAADVLGSILGRPSDEAALALLRVAALSMVLDDAAHAPYGWTHCMTLPQAVLALTARVDRPADALAVAATQVLAFRVSLGGRDLTDLGLLRPVEREASRDRTTALATAGATAHDAHVVKYTLAVIDAARSDSQAADLHLTAGETLLDVWAAAGGDPTDPLA